MESQNPNIVFIESENTIIHEINPRIEKQVKSQGHDEQVNTRGQEEQVKPIRTRRTSKP